MNNLNFYKWYLAIFSGCKIIFYLLIALVVVEAFKEGSWLLFTLFSIFSLISANDIGKMLNDFKKIKEMTKEM